MHECSIFAHKDSTFALVKNAYIRKNCDGTFAHFEKIER